MSVRRHVVDGSDYSEGIRLTPRIRSPYNRNECVKVSRVPDCNGQFRGHPPNPYL